MNYKNAVAKRKTLFSLKTYLLRKTQARADKLQFRAKRNEGTTELTLENLVHVPEEEITVESE